MFNLVILGAVFTKYLWDKIYFRHIKNLLKTDFNNNKTIFLWFLFFFSSFSNLIKFDFISSLEGQSKRETKLYVWY